MRLSRLAPAFTLLAFVGCGDVAAPDRLDPADLRVSAFVGGTPIETLVVEVSATDILTPLLFNIIRDGDVASGVVSVPPGADRTFHVRAYEAGGEVTHEGSRTTDVRRGPNPPLTIPLLPRGGVQPIDIYIGDVAITITPSTGGLAVGSTLQLDAVITGPDGDVIDDDPIWATADPSVASVDPAGLVTGVGVGEVRIAATYSGVVGLAVLEVFDGDLPSCSGGLGQDVVHTINTARLDAGLAPLRVDVRLVAAAEGHSDDMATTGELSHTGSDGSGFSDRIHAQGYPVPSGETVAAGFATGTAVADTWLADALHAAILLEPAARHIGVGYAERDGTPFWTADFGASSTGEEPADGCHPDVS